MRIISLDESIGRPLRLADRRFASADLVRVDVAFAALIYCVLLAATINSSSLWTDEAFSAYLASQNSFGNFISSLIRGDSSDLQAVGYYFYLYVWCHLFNEGEIALRAANAPFILLFACGLVWIASRVFQARWSWIVPAFLPFFWYYASEARAYFAVATMSLLCFGALLAYFEDPIQKERRVFPWIAIGGLLTGAVFHMLMLLAVLPLAAIACVSGRLRSKEFRFSDWIPAIRWLGIPFICYMLYLGWTFLRGESFDYTKPTILSTASVISTLFGLSLFGPNRNYDVNFHPYLALMIVASLTFIIAATGIITAACYTQHRTRFAGLACAAAIAALELIVLSSVTQQQFRVRHLAALTPIVVLVLMEAVAQPATRRIAITSVTSAGLLALLWSSADFRMLFLPQYKKEDYSSAIRKVNELYRQSSVEMAFVGDPFAGSYYGLALTSREPCSPLPDTCDVVFQKVSWRKQAPAIYALQWTPGQIEAWLQDHALRRAPAIVIISDTRELLEKTSAWYPVLIRHRPERRDAVHGFSLFSYK